MVLPWSTWAMIAMLRMSSRIRVKDASHKKATHGGVALTAHYYQKYSISYLIGHHHDRVDDKALPARLRRHARDGNHLCLAGTCRALPQPPHAGRYLDVVVDGDLDVQFVLAIKSGVNLCHVVFLFLLIGVWCSSQGTRDTARRATRGLRRATALPDFPHCAPVDARAVPNAVE